MFATLVRRAVQSAEPVATSASNSYRLKKVWPPDFSKLSPQSQLRFEKKYKRRLALKYARPRWNKAIKLLQFVTITGFLGAMFFSEFEFFGREYRPSEEVRKRLAGLFGSVDSDTRYERRPDAPTRSRTEQAN